MVISIIFPDLITAQTPTLDDKVKGLREAVKEKVQEQLDNLNQGAKRAFVGQITAISEESLSLETSEGVRQINFNTDTIVIDQNRKTIKVTNLKANDYMMTMGYLINDTTLDCRRMVKSEKPKALSKEIDFGKITDISNTGNLITIKNDSKGKTYTISVTKSTKLTQNNANKMADIKVADLKKGNFVIMVGLADQTNAKMITANWIHLMNVSLPETEVSLTPTPTKTLKSPSPTVTKTQ